MPKFARSNSYNGRQATKNWTGDSRFATLGEAAAGASNQLAISPATLDAVSALQLSSPTPIGDIAPNTINGTVISAQTRLEVNGGAVTNSIGTATLVAGVATVLNTNITAADMIIPIRSLPNASTELGVFSYVINAGTSFVITSRDPVDASVATGDLSTVRYLIVRQI